MNIIIANRKEWSSRNIIRRLKHFFSIIANRKEWSSRNCTFLKNLTFIIIANRKEWSSRNNKKTDIIIMGL